jgi:hypothetical protein
LLAVLMALNPLQAGVMAIRVVPPVAATMSAAAVMFEASDAAARSSSSSGGYSRSSSSSSSSFSSSSRTPSASSSGGYSRPSSSSPSPAPSSSSSSSSSSGFFGGSRTPSVAPSGGQSSGYSRPDAGAPAAKAPAGAPSAGAGDQAFSRQGSAQSLGRFRTQQDEGRAHSATSAIPPAGGASSSWGGRDRTPSASSGWGWGGNRQNSWGGGWSPPPYAAFSPPRFGMWNAVALWFLLDTLTRPGHAAFFHDNASDPGYRAWREEADRQARDNAELRAKLDTLDKEMAEMAGKPRKPGRLPDDVTAGQALAEESSSAMQAPASPASKPDRPSSGLGLVWWLVPLLLGVLFVLWRMRRNQASSLSSSAPTTGASSSTSPPSGSQSQAPMFGSLGNYIDRKFSGQRYTPSLFRVGMTVTVDPTPFLLAEGNTRVTAPDTGNGPLVSIEAVGTVRSGNATVHRLYLPNRKSFFQIHLDADGQPDECRYFSVFDEVTPADPAEWGFWLDGNDGMIGWPEFQTKDGKRYPRLWSPGSSRIEPFTLDETIEAVRGQTASTSQAMLYAAPTGAADPAPPTEYLLIETVEADGQAWVRLSAGIDVSPASLSLA